MKKTMFTFRRMFHQQRGQEMEYQWTEIVRLCGQTMVQPCTFPQPVIVQHLANDWPAFRDNQWSFSRLKTRFSQRYFTINDQAIPMQMGTFLEQYGTRHDDHSTETEVDKLSIYIQTLLTSTSIPLTENNVQHLIETIHHHLTSSWSIFDPSFECDAPELLDDYSIPFLFTFNHDYHHQHHHDDLLSIIPTSIRPDHRWFLVGPKGTGSCLHIDPLSTSAWNTLVVGCKHWIIIEPSTSSTTSSSSMRRQIYSFKQYAGETVVIPREWSHAVVNLSFTTAITHNYVAPNVKDIEAFFLTCRMEQKRWEDRGRDEGEGGDGGEGGERLVAWEEEDMKRWERWMKDKVVRMKGKGWDC